MLQWEQFSIESLALSYWTKTILSCFLLRSLRQSINERDAKKSQRVYNGDITVFATTLLQISDWLQHVSLSVSVVPSVEYVVPRHEPEDM